MQIHKILSATALSLLVVISLTARAPVLAEDTTPTTDTPTTSTTKADRAAERKAQLAANAEQRQEDRTAKKTETRQKVCEAHKQGLTTKFSHIVTNSQRIQDRISGVLDKTLAYQQANNLQPANFDSLVSAAQTAKTTSADSITALKAVTPSLDCNNTSVASDVRAFKTAAVATRDNLKAYRATVKAVLKSLETTKQATTEVKQ